jgi:hypothetical protein
MLFKVSELLLYFSEYLSDYTLCWNFFSADIDIKLECLINDSNTGLSVSELSFYFPEMLVVFSETELSDPEMLLKK